MDPVVLFFVLGVVARLARSELRLPESLYEALSIYLLLAIGLKGGMELSQQPALQVLPQIAAGIALGLLIPLIAYPLLRGLVRLARPDAASIAAHYGSVSVVTFAVAQNLLLQNDIVFETWLPLMVAVMEAPGIIMGILLARMDRLREVRWGTLAHEVFMGKSVVLLLGGLIIGAVAGRDGLEPLLPTYMGLFKGLLALFLLEMGLVAGGRLGDIRRAGPRLIAFGIVAPLLFALLGTATGLLMGLSVGGVTIMAALAASASYIAAPTAMRVAVPEANPALSIGVALGVTFPFNIVIGIPLYLWLAEWLTALLR